MCDVLTMPNKEIDITFPSLQKEFEILHPAKLQGFTPLTEMRWAFQSIDLIIVNYSNKRDASNEVLPDTGYGRCTCIIVFKCATSIEKTSVSWKVLFSSLKLMQLRFPLSATDSHGSF